MTRRFVTRDPVKEALLYPAILGVAAELTPVVPAGWLPVCCYRCERVLSPLYAHVYPLGGEREAYLCQLCRDTIEEDGVAAACPALAAERERVA